MSYMTRTLIASEDLKLLCKFSKKKMKMTFCNGKVIVLEMWKIQNKHVPNIDGKFGMS